MQTEKTIYTVKEAAAIMRISASALYGLIRAGKAPHICVGKRRVIPAAKFHEWLNNSITGG